ncbi:MAG: hypothetical protein Q4A62_05515 [Eikenella sp.]|nr:hypothetical protein [Eikenella sp.]
MVGYPARPSRGMVGQMLPVLGVSGALPPTYRRFHFSNLAYVLMSF